MSDFIFPPGTSEEAKKHTEQLRTLVMNCDHRPLLRKLLAGELCLEARDNQGNTLIGIAVKFGNRAAYDALLRRGANIHTKNTFNQTLLHFVAENGDYTICKSLIKHGADIGAFDNDNYAPLHIAIQGNHISLYPLLIGKKVDASTIGTKDKHSPLYLAFIEYTDAKLPGKDTKPGLDSIKELLDMGSNIYAGARSFHDRLRLSTELKPLVKPSIKTYRDFQETRRIHVIDDIYKILAATPLADREAPIDLEAQLRRIFSHTQWRRDDAAVMAEALYQRGTVTASFAEELTAIGSPDKRRTLSIGGRGI